ncbi:Type II toxin-antitoxin system HicB family antitoxin [Candidatus Magnetomoraceae bacterium gMMP-15]
MNTNVRIDIKLPFKIIKQEKWYVSSCPIMDVYSQGETKEKAKNNLIEALTGFFISCIERGTLNDVLKECGFKIINDFSYIDADTAHQEEYINIPIPLLATLKEKEQCRV